MATYIPKDIIKKIINISNIVDIISENIPLKQNGKNFVSLCPFHNEKTPSFTVSPDKQIYYCFGCGEGGNIFSFLMKIKGISFSESVSLISNHYGIIIPTNPKIYKAIGNVNQDNIAKSINYDAMIFFDENLKKLQSQHKAKDYLKKRGITDKTISDFKIGYAPKEWHSLEKYLLKKNWQKNLITNSGLIVIKKGSKINYDRFRNRIIFPIFNSSNYVIGFGGRVINQDKPKYLNSPETSIYKKRKSLYGINLAKQECRKTETIFIVEGYLDLISLHQFGIKNSVAILGTSISIDHIKQIKDLIGKLGTSILVYDSDDAGLKAAQKSLNLFRKEGVDVRILTLPLGHDPNSFIMEFGIKKFIKESKKAKSALSFIIDSEIAKNGLSINGKIKIVNKLKHFIAANDDSFFQKLSIQYLADCINVDEALIQQEVDLYIKKMKPNLIILKNNNKTKSINSKKNGIEFSKTYRLEVQILTMLLQFPDILTIVNNKQITNNFNNKNLQKIANLIIDKSLNGASHLNNIIELCNNEKERSIIAKLSLSKEKWNKNGCMLLIKQFENIVSKEKNYLVKKIAAAEQQGNNELVDKLLKKKHLSAINNIKITNM